MDGIHDMGGMDGFGKVEPEPNEPVFHADWEGRVLAMQRAMGYAGAWHIDMSRFAQERLPPPVYLTASYYQRWALAMERNVVERGYAGADELSAGHALRPGRSLARRLTPQDVAQGMTRGSFYRQAQAPARFKPGDRVRTRNIHPPTHTRLPRYARGSHASGLEPVENISEESNREFARLIAERGLEVTDMPPIAAGDVCFHDGLTVHGAWPNESSQLRYVLALHMFADGARIRKPTTASMRHQLNDFAPGLKPGDPADVPSWPLIYSADEERS